MKVSDAVIWTFLYFWNAYFASLLQSVNKRMYRLEEQYLSVI